MPIFFIMQRCIRVTLCGLVISALSVSLIAQTNGELLDRVEDDTDRWIELQRSLAKENSEWKSDKELLLNSIRILNTEKGIIEKTLESNRLASELYINNEASLKSKIDAQKKALEVISNTLATQREKVDSIVVRLPEPLRSEIEVLALKLNPGEGEQATTVAGRMQSLISILTMIDQFNNSLTLTHQIRKDSNGAEIDTRVLYWGLSVGYAVDAKGELAWRLTPSSDGWAWEDASREAASIEAMLDIYENDRRPSLVPLRATLN